jgi:hypothetical protein
VNLGEPGVTSVAVDGKTLGVLKDGVNSFPLQLSEGEQLPAQPPRIHLVAADEGTWFAPRQARMGITLADGKRHDVARWTPEAPATSAEGINTTILPLVWQPAD